MATSVNPKLFERLRAKTGLSERQTYALIEKKVRQTLLPRHLAAIALAAERGINPAAYATSDELAAIRSATQGAPATTAPAAPAPARRVATRPVPVRRTRRKPATKTTRKPRRNTVFVVHGRDEKLRATMFAFLRAVGLQPLEWTKAIKMTGKPNPHISEIVDTLFREAAAVVVMLSPDDVAKLKPKYLKTTDQDYERKLSGQARANVLFEAGMAMGKDPNSTVLVQIGEVRPFTDVAGRHIAPLSDSAEHKTDFVQRLSNAGCTIDVEGTDWLGVTGFGPPAAASTKRRPKKRKKPARKKRASRR